MFLREKGPGLVRDGSLYCRFLRGSERNKINRGIKYGGSKTHPAIQPGVASDEALPQQKLSTSVIFSPGPGEPQGHLSLVVTQKGDPVLD